MTIPARALGVLAALSFTMLAPSSASAQEDVMRDAFGFFGSSLDVLVDAEAPGRIRFIRGRQSRIEVAGRAPNGFTSAALGGHGVRRLTLTAMGADRVDFVVVVPEDVRVRLYKPGSEHSDLFGTLSESATYAWDTPRLRPAIETVGPRDGYAAAAMPRTLDIRHAARLDHVTLRVRGDVFGMSPRGEARGTAGSLALDARAGETVEIDVPLDADFTLRLDGVDAIVIEGGSPRVLCEAALVQRLPDGTHWLTLTPSDDGCAFDAPAMPASPPGTQTRARRT